MMKSTRLFMILQLLKEETDFNKTLTIKQIQDILSNYHRLEVDRNTLKRDIATLQAAGIDIVEHKIKNNTSTYYLKPSFTKEEMRMLLDSIASNRFIMDRNKNKLINRLLSLVSQNDRRFFKNTVEVDYCVPKNIDMEYNLSKAYEAIELNRKLSFRLGKYKLDKEIEILDKHYEVIPQKICYCNDRYYLVADYETGETRHFRLDRLIGISMGENHKKKRHIDTKVYRRCFDMFGEEVVVNVKMQISKNLLDSVIEHFGQNIRIQPVLNNKEEFIFYVEVSINRGLVRWILKQGAEVKVLYPVQLREKIETEIQKMLLNYQTPIN